VLECCASAVSQSSKDLVNLGPVVKSAAGVREVCVDSLGSLSLSLLDAGKPWGILGNRPHSAATFLSSTSFKLLTGLFCRASRRGPPPEGD
jgi:hypothetical protein